MGDYNLKISIIGALVWIILKGIIFLVVYGHSIVGFIGLNLVFEFVFFLVVIRVILHYVHIKHLNEVSRIIKGVNGNEKKK